MKCHRKTVSTYQFNDEKYDLLTLKKYISCI